jgi:hypothetical protein
MYSPADVWGYACPYILNVDDPVQESIVHIWSSLLNDVEIFRPGNVLQGIVILGMAIQGNAIRFV